MDVGEFGVALLPVARVVALVGAPVPRLHYHPPHPRPHRFGPSPYPVERTSGRLCDAVAALLGRSSTLAASSGGRLYDAVATLLGDRATVASPLLYWRGRLGERRAGGSAVE